MQTPFFKSLMPAKMWIDKGREFYNKDVRKLVELYSTENEEKSCVIERFNRTIKDKIFKYRCQVNIKSTSLKRGMSVGFTPYNQQ